MRNSGYITYVSKKKVKKPVVVLCVIAAVIFVLISAIGIFMNSDTDRKNEIYGAVAENVELKNQITTMQKEIDRLNEEIARLEAGENENEEETGINPASDAPSFEGNVSPRNIAQ